MQSNDVVLPFNIHAPINNILQMNSKMAGVEISSVLGKSRAKRNYEIKVYIYTDTDTERERYRERKRKRERDTERVGD